jgi:hypothetical protein
VTHFESGERFETDEEALQAGIKLGQQKIDVGYEPNSIVVNQGLKPYAALVVSCDFSHARTDDRRNRRPIGRRRTGIGRSYLA